MKNQLEIGDKINKLIKKQNENTKESRRHFKG